MTSFKHWECPICQAAIKPQKDAIQVHLENHEYREVIGLLVDLIMRIRDL